MTQRAHSPSVLRRRSGPPALLAAVLPAAVLLASAACSPETVGRGPLTRPQAAEAAEAAVYETDVPVAALLDAHMQFLASDELGGRETGTLHSRITCLYVASAYRQAGLVPGGPDGSWLQHYPLEAQHLDLETARLSVTTDGRTSELVLLEDWLLGGYGSESISLRAGAVFAGHGLVSEGAGVDDYAGLDVQGKLVLVLSGRPAGRSDLRAAGNWRAKRAAARERGALGLVQLVLGKDAEAERLVEFARHRILSPSMSMPDADPADAWPMLTVIGPAARDLARAAGMALPDERDGGDGGDGSADGAADGRGALPPPAPGPLPGLEFTLQVDVATERVLAGNVLGVMRGADPALAHEYVIVSAHNDHVGILPDGRVNNGADDNASGTATIMAAAAVLAAGPPLRRSVLFLSVSGEEKGLLGSEWWCEHPTVPLADVVADINIDMVGRNDPTAVGATPSPAHPHYNTLVERARVLAPAAGLELSWTAPRDGDDLVDNYYARSDHYNFAQHDIPVVFFFSGLHEDYHRPTDELPKIRMDKLERMVLYVAVGVRDVRSMVLREARPEEHV
jgi:hypothetical protein